MWSRIFGAINIGVVILSSFEICKAQDILEEIGVLPDQSIQDQAKMTVVSQKSAFNIQILFEISVKIFIHTYAQSFFQIKYSFFNFFCHGF